MDDMYCELCDSYDHDDCGHERIYSDALSSLDIDVDTFLDMDMDEFEDVLAVSSLDGSLTLEQVTILQFEFYEHDVEED